MPYVGMAISRVNRVTRPAPIGMGLGYINWVWDGYVIVCET